MNIFFNTALVQQDHLNLALNDRAFSYGDGLFETLISLQGQLLFWPNHYQRLSAGMAALAMQPPEYFSAALLEKQMQQLLNANELTDTARLRIQVWRQAGGLYTPTTQAVNVLITAQACARPQVSVKRKALFYKDHRLHYSTISAYKTCNALPYVLAGIAKTQADAEEMILLDTNGYLAECVASNLFWIKDQVFYTPSLQSGCIAGIMRQQIIQRIQTRGLSVREGLFNKEMLLEADDAFCCNVAGIQWLAQIENKEFSEERRPAIEQWLFSWSS
ncbi:MAG: aminotransferase class IV [Bacteroidota bacterium]